jgi:hypothetical protein
LTTKVPRLLLQHWHNLLVQEIKTLIESTEQTVTAEGDPLNNFLKLLKPEQLSKITITEFLRAPQRHQKDVDDQSEENKTEFGKIGATTMANNIGTSVQKEHNLQLLSLPENKREVHLLT